MSAARAIREGPRPFTRCDECPIRAKALFQAVSEDYVLHAQEYRQGQYLLPAKGHLYREGESPTMAYTLFDGWIMLYRQSRDGNRQGLRIALPGDFIGYHSRGASAVQHSAMAITESRLCGFRHPDLERMLHGHSHLAMQLVDIQARDMASCQDQMLGLGRKRAEGRVAHLMLDLFERLKTRGATDGQSIAFPLTQEMIGDLTGLTVVHTNRVIQKLRGDGMIECGGRRLDLKDIAGLREIAEFQQPDPKPLAK